MISASITIFDENNRIDDAEMQKLWKKNIKDYGLWRKTENDILEKKI